MGQKIGHLLEQTTNRSNYGFLHKVGSAGRLGPAPLLETDHSPREQHLESIAGGLEFLIPKFQSMCCPLLQKGVKHWHAANSRYRCSRCLTAVYHLVLTSKDRIMFDNAYL